MNADARKVSFRLGQTSGRDAERLEPELLAQLASDREILTSRIRLVENMKIFPRQACAAKAVSAAGTRHTLYHVRARGTAFTFDTVLAPDERLAVAAMGAVCATQAANAIMAANQALRVFAEGAVAATFAASTGDAARVGRALPQLANQIAKA